MEKSEGAGKQSGWQALGVIEGSRRVIMLENTKMNKCKISTSIGGPVNPTNQQEYLTTLML